MVNFDNFRVYLRALEIDDYKVIHEIRKQEDVILGYSKFNTFPSSENDKKWVESRIFNKDEVTCAICLKETNEVIGCIFLLDIDMHNRVASCPLFLSDKFYGKGYAREARFLMLKYAFYERGLLRVTDYVNENNKASLQLHKRCGYVLEGAMRSAIFKNGIRVNLCVLGCLKEDFDEIINE